jgi:hypothetical protein
MNAIKNFVVPIQIIMLFIVPAVMLMFVICTIAGLVTFMSSQTFLEFIRSGPGTLIEISLYLIFMFVVGNYMWED